MDRNKISEMKEKSIGRFNEGGVSARHDTTFDRCMDVPFRHSISRGILSQRPPYQGSVAGFLRSAGHAVLFPE